MNEDQIKDLLESKFKSVNNGLQDLRDTGASKAELQKATDAVKTQGTILQDFLKEYNDRQVKSYMEKFSDFLGENKDALKDIYQKGSGSIEFNPFEGQTKAVGDISSTSGTDEETPPPVRGFQPGSFNLRNDNALLNLCTVSSTNSASIAYTEMLPKEGNYNFVVEGASKPQIDFSWETRYPSPKKIAAHEILTEEVVTDFARMESIAKEYLSKKHDLFKVNGIFFADGSGSLPTGATEYARTFVATGLTDVFANGTSNIMDVINACITDIYRTANFTDEDHYMANIAMINPIDFFVNFQAAKDNNGLPLYPSASLFNSVTIGGVTIMPWIKIPTGKVFVADMSKYHVVNYVPFSIRIGWINDQFITNKFTMVGESRFFQYVKNLDQAAFIYDDIATVQAAIEAA